MHEKGQLIILNSACVSTFYVFKVQTKTVAQCVEFYYTYKKQVKIGRNGILTFGPPDSPLDKHTEAVVDVKVEWSYRGFRCTTATCGKVNVPDIVCLT